MVLAASMTQYNFPAPLHMGVGETTYFRIKCTVYHVKFQVNIEQTHLFSQVLSTSCCGLFRNNWCALWTYFANIHLMERKNRNPYSVALAILFSLADWSRNWSGKCNLPWVRSTHRVDHRHILFASRKYHALFGDAIARRVISVPWALDLGRRCTYFAHCSVHR